MAMDREEITAQMREAVADFVGIDPDKLDLNKKLRLEYNLTSVEAAELIMVMEDTYKIKIPVEEAKKILSTQQAIDYVMANAK
jgi:acyl carrier protein